MIKPQVLYHASSNRNIAIFEPRSESYRDLEEGPVVFATPYIDYASCFIVGTDDSWARISQWGKDTHWNMIISGKERFDKLDKGGTIYELPTDSFYCDLTKGTRESEWISKSPVKPIKRTVYQSGLKAMLNNGVKVFFVTKDVFKKITNAKDHGYVILKGLKPYAQS